MLCDRWHLWLLCGVVPTAGSDHWHDRDFIFASLFPQYPKWDDICRSCGNTFEYRHHGTEQHCAEHHGRQPERLCALDGRECLRRNTGGRIELLNLRDVYTGYGYQLLGDIVGS
jgi:hypothetical protein